MVTTANIIHVVFLLYLKKKLITLTISKMRRLKDINNFHREKKILWKLSHCSEVLYYYLRNLKSLILTFFCLELSSVSEVKFHKHTNQMSSENIVFIQRADMRVNIYFRMS